MRENDTSTTLITGATGMIGRLLTGALVERGVAFTAMVRGSASGVEDRPGVRVVPGDFDDADSLAAALNGVRRAFLLTNSTERTEAQQTAFVRAAAAGGVEHVVKLSQLHAREDSPVRFLRYHAAVERAIEEAGLPFTFVRPNLILQAYLPFAPMIAAGSLAAPLGDARVSVVDARDIAAVAATALTEDGHEGRRYDVTGPAAVTHAEIAAAFGGAIGHEVRFTSIAAEDFVAAVTAQGMPAWQAEGLAEDYAHYDRGEADGVSDDVRSVTGSPPRSVDAFAADYAAQLQAA